MERHLIRDAILRMSPAGCEADLKAEARAGGEMADNHAEIDARAFPDFIISSTLYLKLAAT